MIIISTCLKKNKKKNKKNKKKQDEKTIDTSGFNELIIKKETDINKELFMKHFKIQRPSDIFKLLYEAKDKENNNNDLLNVIDSGIKDLNKEIKKMSKEEIEIEKPDKIVEIAEEILRFNNQKQK